MKIAFDLDGVFYDFLDICLGVDNKMFRNFNYPKVSSDTYKKHFQTKDWKKFYRDLGIQEQHLDEMIALLKHQYKNSVPLPNLIPGSTQALELTEKNIGLKNLYFITNTHNTTKRFEKDNLLHYLHKVRISSESKTPELYSLAQEQTNTPFIYIGDIVSDGEACLEARKLGAKNIQFYGIIHEYAMNHPQDMKHFVDANKNFAKTLNNLDEIEKIWSP